MITELLRMFVVLGLLIRGDFPPILGGANAPPQKKAHRELQRVWNKGLVNTVKNNTVYQKYIDKRIKTLINASYSFEKFNIITLQAAEKSCATDPDCILFQTTVWDVYETRLCWTFSCYSAGGATQGFSPS